MTRIYETDKINAGNPQLILENDLISVLLQPEIGGRILDVETNGFPFLHRTYPKSVQFGPYIEYGGIEECIGSPLTSRLWKTPWRVDKEEDRVTLSVISSTRFSKVLLSKTMSLEPDAPILKIEYSFTNFDRKFNKFTFGIHPELCLGNALKDNTYHVPTDDDVLSGGFTSPGAKQFVIPCDGWKAVTFDDMAFGMLFPMGVIDSVEVYYPRIGTHFVLQPLIYGVGLSPNRRASFTSMLYFGPGDVDTIRALYAQKQEALTMSYVPIEIPPEQIADEEWLTQRRPQVVLPFEEFGPLSLDVVGQSLEATTPLRVNVPLHMGADAPIPGLAPETENGQPDNQLDDAVAETNSPTVLREHRRFDHQEITDVRLSNVNGTIYIEGWEEDGIVLETILQFLGRTETEAKGRIEDARPEIIQHGKLLLIRARGEAQGDVVINQYLRVPRCGMRTLEVNFGNGEASLINVQPTRLKMSSMEGTVTIRGPIDADAEYDVNTASGNICVELSDATACAVNASSVTGRLTCQLELIEADKRATWISGVYNAPEAQLRVSSISGDITLTTVNGGTTERKAKRPSEIE